MPRRLSATSELPASTEYDELRDSRHRQLAAQIFRDLEVWPWSLVAELNPKAWSIHILEKLNRVVHDVRREAISVEELREILRISAKEHQIKNKLKRRRLSPASLDIAIQNLSVSCVSSTREPVVSSQARSDATKSAVTKRKRAETPLRQQKQQRQDREAQEEQVGTAMGSITVANEEVDQEENEGYGDAFSVSRPVEAQPEGIGCNSSGTQVVRTPPSVSEGTRVHESSSTTAPTSSLNPLIATPSLASRVAVYEHAVQVYGPYLQQRRKRFQYIQKSVEEKQSDLKTAQSEAAAANLAVDRATEQLTSHTDSVVWLEAMVNLASKYLSEIVALPTGDQEMGTGDSLPSTTISDQRSKTVEMQAKLESYRDRTEQLRAALNTAKEQQIVARDRLKVLEIDAKALKKEEHMLHLLKQSLDVLFRGARDTQAHSVALKAP